MILSRGLGALRVSFVVEVCMFFDLYKNKTVLITGHTGFKGGWLALWLKLLGAKVVGYSLPPNSKWSLYNILGLDRCLDYSIFGNICDEKKVMDCFSTHSPDVVFHLAAQPLVYLSYSDPVNTYETNVIGTLKVLECARKTPSVKAFVNVTSDKCYENEECMSPHCEDDPMGGYDMYSSSKGCSELLTSSYRRSFLGCGKPFALASGRSGNVIGGGDWSKDRLVPDCIRSFQDGEPVLIRCPHAVRQWTFVLDSLAGYLRLGQKLLEDGKKYASGYNFGSNFDECVDVTTIVKNVAEAFGGGTLKIKQGDMNHESASLRLDCRKSEKELGVKSVYTLKKATVETVQWYKAFYEHKTNMLTYSQQQIDDFCTVAKSKHLAWAEESCL